MKIDNILKGCIKYSLASFITIVIGACIEVKFLVVLGCITQALTLVLTLIILAFDV
jgi:hypothetical protein